MKDDATKPQKPVRVPSPKLSDASDRDDDSAKEAQLLASGKSVTEIKREAKVREFDRTETFKDHFERIAVVGLYVASTALLLVGIALFAHMLLPLGWHWLESDQQANLKSVFTGGALAGIVATHLRKRTK